MNSRSVMIILNDAGMYGANLSALNLILSIQRTQDTYKAVVVSQDGPIVSKLRASGLRVNVVPFKASIAHPRRELWACATHVVRSLGRTAINFVALLRIGLIARRVGIEVIHSNTSTFDIGWRTARAIGARHVWHVRENIIDISNGFIYGGVNQHLEKIASSGCIVFSSHFLSTLYRNATGAFVVYDAVRSRIPAVERTRQADRSSRYFVICASIDPNKKIEDAIMALGLLDECYKDVELLVAGTGNLDYVAQLKRLTELKGVSYRTRFLGYCSDIDALLTNAEAVLVCSRSEGLGRVTIEAMLCDCPVIGFNSSGTAELLDSGRRGLLYNNLNDLVSAMNRVLRDRGSIEPITFAAKRFATEFCLEPIAGKQVLKIYNDLAADSSNST